jgi:F-type H+-transporting ATPase subunit a
MARRLPRLGGLAVRGMGAAAPALALLLAPAPAFAKLEPLHQFEIRPILPALGFTNSALLMVITVAIVAFLVIAATGKRAMVPGRLQSIAEVSYEFVAHSVKLSAGTEGMRFFPFVFTLFMFLVVANVIGLIPFSFTVTSHIIVTVALALLVFSIVVVYGFWHNGLRFLKVFVPSGIPVLILPLIVAIEILSFFSRPISHSVRLFANMLAGHITLQVFAGFITLLLAAGSVLGWFAAVLSFVLIVALMALELLVAFLQAYVFAVLTCIYLSDAIHPGH